MARNKQPWYHHTSFVLTATRPIPEKQMAKLLNSMKNIDSSIVYIELEAHEDPEPGDPADLM